MTFLPPPYGKAMTLHGIQEILVNGETVCADAYCADAYCADAYCADAYFIARMYGYPGPSHDDLSAAIAPEMPSDCEPSPPVVDTKAAEVLPEDEAERMMQTVRDIARGQ